MLKAIKFIAAGIAFGIIMTKSEAISWYRIQEMFRFQAFHMYGIIGTAVLVGVVGIWTIKRFRLKDFEGQAISIPPKAPGFVRYILGGTIFGLGWALTGACPGPMFVNLGYGYGVFLVVIASALLGTLVYGVLRDKLPH
jgi:hypothetical protein